MKIAIPVIVLLCLFPSQISSSHVVEQEVTRELNDKAQMIEYVIENGSPVLVEIMRCESGFRQFNEDGSVLRGNVNSQDVGAFQINEKYHLEESIKLGYDIYTTKGNLDYGIELYKRQGSQPWFWSKSCWGK